VKTPLDIKQAADMIGDHLRGAGYAVPRHVALELSAKLARFRNLHAAQNAAPAAPAPTATLPPVRPAEGAPESGAERTAARKPTIIRAIRADLTTLDVDAVVNPSNSQLNGAHGIDSAIHRAAGPELLLACFRLGGCLVGDAKITEGYRLRARYIIHTVGPIWLGGTVGEPEMLASCYRRSLEVAAANGVSSLAFASISTGIRRYPVAGAAEVAVATVRASVGMLSTIQEVIFCCYSEADLKAHERALVHAPQLLTPLHALPENSITSPQSLALADRPKNREFRVQLRKSG
jgi:O-acetyl-ADP-ribose deacetylase (regulator of RNase III)